MLTQQPQGQTQVVPGSRQQHSAGNTTVVVTQTSPTPVQSFVVHIALAGVVYCCCGCIFGAIAFIFALVGQDKANTGDAEGASAMGRASMGVSIAGLVIGAVVIIALIAYFAVFFNQVANDDYDWNK